MKLVWNIAPVQYRSLDLLHCSSPRYKWASGRPQPKERYVPGQEESHEHMHSVVLCISLSLKGILLSLKTEWFGLCCLMTPGLNKDIWCHLWPYFSKLANHRHRSDIRSHGLSAWWLTMVPIMFLRGLCGYVCMDSHTHFIKLIWEGLHSRFTNNEIWTAHRVLHWHIVLFKMFSRWLFCQ